MSTWFLFITLFGSGSGSSDAMYSMEFTSHAKCEQALATWKANTDKTHFKYDHSYTAVCLEK